MALLSDWNLPAIDIEPASRTGCAHACYVQSQGAPLLAWLHGANPAIRRGHGVLMCAPAGHEQIHAHRTLRKLAETWADAGFDVVRFDYQGAGDSAELFDQADVLQIWLNNIRDMLAWMKDSREVETISLFGLRFGATLAVQIAAEQSVDGLILWEPIVRGRAYARELKALGMIGGPNPAGIVEAAGFAFSDTLLTAIGKLDLLSLQPKCRRALILSRDDVPGDEKLAQHFASLGIDASHDPFVGYADMLAEPHLTKVPKPAIARSGEWLAAGAPIAANHASCGAASTASRTTSFGNRVREHLLTVGDKPTLAAILSAPEHATVAPLVVFPNAGSAYHVGPGRLYVDIPRHLAEAGFPCLRFDLSGLGDSGTHENQTENDCYTRWAFQDIDRILQFAQSKLGAERIVLMGLCSGAYFAFQSAAQIKNPALVESILINPLAFFWQDGMVVQPPEVIELFAYEYYKGAAASPRNWWRLLTGQTKIGILGALRMLARRWGFGRSNRGAGETELLSARPLGHPAKDDLSADLDRVERFDRYLACFFSRSDPGHALLMMRAGDKATQMQSSGRLTCQFIEDADHTFSRQKPRRELINALIAYLTARYR